MYIEQVKRATGRTTRLLRDAIERHKSGHKVVILVHSQTFANQLKFGLYGPELSDIPVDNYYLYLARPEVEAKYHDFDKLIDHHALEKYHHSVIENWIKYDEPTPQPNWVVDGSCPKENGMYLVTVQSNGRRSTQVTHWDTQNGWLAPQGEQWIVAWAHMPKPFGYTGEPS